MREVAYSYMRSSSLASCPLPTVIIGSCSCDSAESRPATSRSEHTRKLSEMAMTVAVLNLLIREIYSRGKRRVGYIYYFVVTIARG